MASQEAGSFFVKAFGEGKGSGAAMLFLIIAIVGTITCIVFRKDPHIWNLERKK